MLARLIAATFVLIGLAMPVAPAYAHDCHVAVSQSPLPPANPPAHLLLDKSANSADGDDSRQGEAHQAGNRSAKIPGSYLEPAARVGEHPCWRIRQASQCCCPGGLPVADAANIRVALPTFANVYDRYTASALTSLRMRPPIPPPRA